MRWRGASVSCFYGGNGVDDAEGVIVGVEVGVEVKVGVNVGVKV
jgi:hypothetical protein